MKRKYELTVIYGENDPEKQEGIAFAEETLGKHSAEVLKRDEIGSRVLAYEIGGKQRGFYVFYLLECDTDAVSAISSELSLSHLIMRYLFVVREELTPAQREKRERKAEKIRKHLAKKQGEEKPAQDAVAEASDDREGENE